MSQRNEPLKDQETKREMTLEMALHCMRGALSSRITRTYEICVVRPRSETQTLGAGRVISGVTKTGLLAHPAEGLGDPPPVEPPK